MANANINHEIAASNESDDLAPLFRTPTPPRPHTSPLLIRCAKGALLMSALFALAALASHAANGPSHAAPGPVETMANKTVGLQAGVPCQCESANPNWGTTSRTIPKCIFIDLGAARANTFNSFISNGYGLVQNCPSGGQWEAWLVEANPVFDDALNLAKQTYPGQVHPLGSTAAYSCVGSVSFNIDPDVAHDAWGSSMKTNTFRDGAAVRTVTVPTVNVIQLIAENTIPADYVILKSDIEGAEFDLFPCISASSQAHLIDAVYVEEHPWLQGNAVYTPAEYQASKQSLAARGVYFKPNYKTPTRL